MIILTFFELPLQINKKNSVKRLSYAGSQPGIKDCIWKMKPIKLDRRDPQNKAITVAQHYYSK